MKKGNVRGGRRGLRSVSVREGSNRAASVRPRLEPAQDEEVDGEDDVAEKAREGKTVSTVVQ
jgi:hypothetical protein